MSPGSINRTSRRSTCQNQVHLIDAPPDGHIRTPSRPHVATIFYTPFSTTHFYLLITGLILTYIPESFNPNLVETQNIILNRKKRVGALLKFRVQETRKTCKIFIEMEEVHRKIKVSTIIPCVKELQKELELVPFSQKGTGVELVPFFSERNWNWN